MKTLTFDRANEKLTYCPETGEVRWKSADGRKVKVGDLCGGRYGNGYGRVCIDYQEYLLHRVVWLMHHGVWPDRQIDHINGIRTDNRICNLRLATPAENHQNYKRRCDNKSGVTGVTWFKSAGKWRADIQVNKQQIYLGSFDTIEEAAAAYSQAKQRLHTFQPVSRAA